MTASDQPSRVMDLMAAFGRRHKAASAPKPAAQRTRAAGDAPQSEAASQQAQRLKTNRLRPTQARTRVLSALEQAAPHSLDTTQLLRILIPQLVRPTPATVYRALHDLWAAGLLVRTQGARGRALYALKPETQNPLNITLRCRCGARLVVIEDQALRVHLRALASEAGFLVDQEPVFSISMVCTQCGQSHQERL